MVGCVFFFFFDSSFGLDVKVAKVVVAFLGGTGDTLAAGIGALDELDELDKLDKLDKLEEVEIDALGELEEFDEGPDRPEVGIVTLSELASFNKVSFAGATSGEDPPSLPPTMSMSSLMWNLMRFTNFLGLSATGSLFGLFQWQRS